VNSKYFIHTSNPFIVPYPSKLAGSQMDVDNGFWMDKSLSGSEPNDGDDSEENGLDQQHQVKV
jgi:hypothetical protein